MTKHQDNELSRFHTYATFGCISNPNCYVCAARNLANDLGLDGDQMLQDLADKIVKGLKAARPINNRPDTIRWIFVKRWIISRL